MTQSFLALATTPAVLAHRKALGSDRMYASALKERTPDRFSEREAAFIAERDSFFLSSVSESGWPYVQHRGGPAGFLKVVDETTLAFADFRGNRQYVSLGNITADDRACLILMDYAHARRLKIYVHVEAVALDADPELAKLVSLPDYEAQPERILRLKLEAFDWNCPQHITLRFTEKEINDALVPLRQHLSALEAENAELKKKLGL